MIDAYYIGPIYWMDWPGAIIWVTIHASASEREVMPDA